MCRVLLVDDEKMARVGLRSVFNWEGSGFELVGEASNGQKAMKWIENQEVDILITDIAMPVMDGLELTRKTRELCPWVKVLLLSCHNDFEYVREGIRLGASDYILKPTLTNDSLEAVLQQMRQKLEEEREHRQILELFKDQQHANKLRALEQTFSKALCGDREATERLKLACPQESYRFVALGLDVSAESDAEAADLLIGQSESLKSQLYQSFRSFVAVPVRPDLLLAIVPGQGSQHGNVNELIDRLSKDTASSRFHISIGISGVCDGYHDIQNACMEAKRALAYVFFSRPSGLLPAEAQTAPASAPPYDYAAALNGLKESLTMGFHSKSEAYMDQVMTFWTPQFRSKEEVLQEAEELLSLFALCKDFNPPIVRKIRQLSKLRYVEDVIRHVKACFEALRVGDESQKTNKTLHQRIVMQAIHFIEGHYRESITLQQVADDVNVSRNYFSEMFKRVTGQNFIDYVIALRVKRAKELLQGSSLKVYEVAEQAGFNDVKHFSKQFKKIVGLSPAEFRGSLRK